MFTRYVLEKRLEVVREMRQDTEKRLIRLQAQEDVLQGLLDLADEMPAYGLQDRYLRLVDKD